jgi:2-keto-3-deoxy-L-fuconate dehydrogenase
MHKALAGKRVLITQATEFMGPALCEVFAEQGAQVQASAAPLAAPGSAERVVADSGPLDVLVAKSGVRGADDAGA